MSLLNQINHAEIELSALAETIYSKIDEDAYYCALESNKNPFWAIIDVARKEGLHNIKNRTKTHRQLVLLLEEIWDNE